MSCPTYDGILPGLRRYLLPCGDPHRPKFVGHEMTTCSPPWPSHQLTLTPLGIRRNMSRVAHNPGTTAAGMQCKLLICACVPAPARVCRRLDLRFHAHMLCDRFACVRPVGHSTKTWLDPASACAASTTPRIRGMGWGDWSTQRRPTIGAGQPVLQDPATVKNQNLPKISPATLVGANS